MDPDQTAPCIQIIYFHEKNLVWGALEYNSRRKKQMPFSGQKGLTYDKMPPEGGGGGLQGDSQLLLYILNFEWKSDEPFRASCLSQMFNQKLFIFYHHFVC